MLSEEPSFKLLVVMDNFNHVEPCRHAQMGLVFLDLIGSIVSVAILASITWKVLFPFFGKLEVQLHRKNLGIHEGTSCSIASILHLSY